jgi:ribosomal protein S18 acetylase RimI-like enzyme
MDDFDIVEYSHKYGRELVAMWRDSFQRAVGVVNIHSFNDDLEFLDKELVKDHRVVVVLERSTSKVIGFMASTHDTISQIYLHVDHQNRGLGSVLMSLAKRQSNGRLRLFTFKSNENAQRFYKRHGFKIVKYGFENELGLEDIEYEWSASAAD